MKMEMIRYRTEHQGPLEHFLREARNNPQYPFDPEGAHRDMRKIPETYQVRAGQFWLLMHEDSIIGTIALKALDDDFGEVKRLLIHQDYRGRGYGEQMFRHLLQHAKSKGFKALRLDSIRSYKPAIGLYKKLGFVEIERYNENPVADIFMELRL